MTTSTSHRTIAAALAIGALLVLGPVDSRASEPQVTVAPVVEPEIHVELGPSLAQARPIVVATRTGCRPCAAELDDARTHIREEVRHSLRQSLREARASLRHSLRRLGRDPAKLAGILAHREWIRHGHILGDIEVELERELRRHGVGAADDGGFTLAQTIVLITKVSARLIAAVGAALATATQSVFTVLL